MTNSFLFISLAAYLTCHAIQIRASGEKINNSGRNKDYKRRRGNVFINSPRPLKGELAIPHGCCPDVPF